MSTYLEYKSQNPYELKKRKEYLKTTDDSSKVEALMKFTYTESPFFGTFYKNSSSTNIQSFPLASKNKRLSILKPPAELIVSQAKEAQIQEGEDNNPALKPSTKGAQADKSQSKVLRDSDDSTRN